MDRALYFPYIKVPQNSWFTRILLYWDEVGAIVPSEYIENPDHLGSYMVGLVKERLVHQVFPGPALWDLKSFEPAFREYLDNSVIDKRVPSTDNWTPIHFEKLQHVGEMLCSKGLAQSREPYSPWYLVEPSVALAFMTYLATVLAKVTDSNSYTPVTDEKKNLFVLRKTPTESRSQFVREVILKRIFPSPIIAIDPPRLAEFKAKHGHLLIEFRREIEERVLLWSMIGDDVERIRLVEIGISQLQERIAEIASRMISEKWNQIDYGGSWNMIGLGNTAIDAINTGEVGSAAFGASIALAPYIIKAIMGKRPQVQSPLAYAVLASRDLEAAI